MNRFWYYFIGAGDETLLIRYGRIVDDPSPQYFCASGQNICAIYATPNFLDPSVPAAITTNLRNYFIEGRASGGYLSLQIME